VIDVGVDASGAVEIAPRVWWVGSNLSRDQPLGNVYLIEQGDQSVLIDPGSALIVDEVVRKVEAVVGLRNVRWLVCSQPDSDVTAALPALVSHGLHPEAAIITHGRSEASISHTGTSLPLWRVEEHHLRLELEDRTLRFVLIPYLHFAGAFCTYDQGSETLFSSDLFSGLAAGDSLYVSSDDYFDSIRTFHEHYVPSHEILVHALHQLRELPIQLIAPRHGRVIPSRFVDPVFDLLENLECGIILIARDDPGLAFLLDANRTIHDVIDTLVREQNFSIVAAYLADLASRSLGAAYFELWAGTPETMFRFDQSDSYAGHLEEAPTDVMDVLRGSASVPGTRLILPLRSKVTEQINGVMVWGFREPRTMSEASMAVLSQIIRLVEVGLEREVLRRSADLERTAWRTQAIHDSLTGLYNRVSLDDSFHRLAAFDDRNADPQMAALMIDIDFFKTVNDTLGHAAGDEVIRRVAESIMHSVRPSDLTFRYGGEEFLVFLSNVDATTAMKAAERIRQRVSDSGSELPTVNVSIGVALRQLGERHETLIARADQALFRAKQKGRNRVEMAL
jgi:diguanylate cyclase (GGDEF)-like protein